ncbi:Protein FAR-RED ELONGATED HYPOCOTYL 3 [Ancistrocladus abbreviatus]
MAASGRRRAQGSVRERETKRATARGSWTDEEFEKTWQALLNIFALNDDEWVQSLIQDCKLSIHKWVAISVLPITPSSLATRSLHASHLQQAYSSLRITPISNLLTE